MVHKQGTKGGKGGRKLSQSLSSPMGTPRGEERQLPLLAGNSSSSRPLGSRKASSCTLSPSIPALPTSSTSPPQPQVAKASNQGHTTSAQPPTSWARSFATKPFSIFNHVGDCKSFTQHLFICFRLHQQRSTRHRDERVQTPICSH